MNGPATKPLKQRDPGVFTDPGPYLSGSVYLTVRRDRPYRLTVVKSTQSAPASVPAGCCVVRVTLRVHADAFKPIDTEAVTVGPDDVAYPVAVQADNDTPGGDDE